MRRLAALASVALLTACARGHVTLPSAVSLQAGARASASPAATAASAVPSVKPSTAPSAGPSVRPSASPALPGALPRLQRHQRFWTSHHRGRETSECQLSLRCVLSGELHRPVVLVDRAFPAHSWHVKS